LLWSDAVRRLWLSALFCVAFVVGSAPSSAGAQHVLTQRSRDVTLGRLWGIEQGMAYDVRLDVGFGDGSAVYRNDVAVIYSYHPDAAYKERHFDWHVGVLASYAHGGALEMDGSDRRGAFMARPFVLIPIRTGELLLSVGVGYANGRLCAQASSDGCRDDLVNRARAALARPSDLVELAPHATLVRTLFSYRIDYGVLSVRLDAGYDRVLREAWHQDATQLYQALGIAVSTTRFSILLDQTFLLGACNALWGTSGDQGICWGRRANSWRRMNVVSLGLRFILGRHAQWVMHAAMPFPFHRFGMVGTAFEFPF
jgi:hypothetical protein